LTGNTDVSSSNVRIADKPPGTHDNESKFPPATVNASKEFGRQFALGYIAKLT
jgi:hypothetical protein